MKLPNFVNPSTDSLPTIGHDLSNKEVKNESYQELHSLNKKGAAKSVFFIEKQIRKIWMDVDGFTKFGNFICVQLIFGQKSYF